MVNIKYKEGSLVLCDICSSSVSHIFGSFVTIFKKKTIKQFKKPLKVNKNTNQLVHIITQHKQ